MAVLISVGFITAWTPYVAVSFWSMFHSQQQDRMAPLVSLLPCLFAKSSTTYNPFLYFIFRPTSRNNLLHPHSFCFCCPSSPVEEPKNEIKMTNSSERVDSISHTAALHGQNHSEYWLWGLCHRLNTGFYGVLYYIYKSVHKTRQQNPMTWASSPGSRIKSLSFDSHCGSLSSPRHQVFLLALIGSKPSKVFYEHILSTNVVIFKRCFINILNKKTKVPGVCFHFLLAPMCPRESHLDDVDEFDTFPEHLLTTMQRHRII